MTEEAARIPESAKITPRCPLCHAMFDRKVDAARQSKLKTLFAEAIVLVKNAKNDKELAKAKRWGQMLEDSIKAGAAEVFLCHFCRIGIGANDPFVGRWDEAYAKGDKIMCPACDHEMRYFCTSTGYMQAKCPVKACQSKMELGAPDRKDLNAHAAEGEAPGLTDAQGRPIVLPNIDRAISTPEAPATGQAGASGLGKDPNLPDEVEIKLPSPEFGGNA